MNEQNEYAKDVYVDPFALHKESRDQPALMKKYTGILADAKKEVDRISEKLAVCKANLDKKIRKKPEKFGVDKLTENIIFSTIIIQKKYREIMAELIDAKHEKEVASGAVTAMEHKKSSIELLTKLLGMDYYAGPSTPNTFDEKISKDKSASKKVKIKRNK